MLRSWIFFYGSGDNRDLHVPTHSFPTRRSSELRALHDFGGRRDGAFVAINCGAVPAEIIESELFGHVAGAFTGAQKPRTGKLEFADRSEEHTSELQSLMRISYPVFGLQNNNTPIYTTLLKSMLIYVHTLA